MALSASIISPATSSFRVKLLKHGSYQFNGSTNLRSHHLSFPKCSIKVAMASFDEPQKVRLELDNVKEKLIEAVPDSVKGFPWKEADSVLRHRVMLFGKKAVNLLLVPLFVISSLSDVIFAISKSKELMVPLGLFVGCLTTDFLREIFQEMFGNPEGDEYHLRQVTVISCFFVLVKFASAFCTLRARVLLLHFANGGLMQLLWLWRNKLRRTSNEQVPSVGEGEQVSSAMDAED